MSRMPWSKLQRAILERLAPSIRSRVAIHQARYRNTREEAGRVWITLDGREVIAFATVSYVARRAQISHEMRSGAGPFALSASSDHAEYLAADAAAVAMLRVQGEYDDYAALKDLEDSLSMSVEEAAASPAPLLRALAVMDKRLGKRRLRALWPLENEHPLVRELYLARCEAEGLRLPSGAI